MDLKEKVKRLILLEEGELIQPLSEFERACLEFCNYLKKEAKRDFYFMWDDDWLKRNFEKIKKMADSNEPVLLLGESGSGKELISRFIHFLSKRKDNSKIKKYKIRKEY